jgi:hypothetical protein
MKTWGIKSFTIVMALFLALSFAACESDSGDTTEDAATTEDSAGGDTTEDAAGDDTAVADKTFTGILIDFKSKQQIAGATVTVLDNDTGEPLKDADGVVMETTSGAAGEVTFTFPGSLDKVGFLAVLDGQKDTYQFQLPADGVEETLWTVDTQTYVGAPALAGVAQDSALGVLAGGIYYMNPEGEEEAIGCATADTDPAGGEVRYFGASGLPTTLDKQPSINPAVPYYLIANIPVGKTTIKAFDSEGNEIGDTFIHSVAGAICIGNIYANDTVTANPTPVTCQ